MVREELRYNPLDLEPDVAIGIGLPLVNADAGKYKTPQSGSLEQGAEDVGSSRMTGGVFHSTYTTIEQTKANIKNLVLTNPGERLYHPNFGIGVQGLLFENITKSKLEALKKSVYDQVAIWLPFVTLKNVIVDVTGIDSNTLRISIDYIIFENDTDLQSVVIFA